MDPTTVIDAILESGDPRKTQALFREHAGAPDFASAYFSRVLAAFGANPKEAMLLAAHWRLLLKYGRDPAFAYRTKGAADRLAGRWLDSARAFVRAGAVAGREIDRLSFQVGAVDSFARAGRVAEAISLGKRLSRGLDQLGEHALAGRVRLNVGNALLWQDRYRESRKWLREAIAALDGSPFANEAIYARVGLSTAEIFGGSPAEAHRIALEARDAAAEAGLEHSAVLAELNVAQAALQQGRADEALQKLLRVRRLLEDSPHDLARTIEFTGFCYLSLNLWREAADAFDAALSFKRHLPLLNVADCHLGAGQARLAEGDRKQAIVRLEKARRAFVGAGNQVWAASAQTWLARAHRESGATKQASRLAEKAVRHARTGGSGWHEASALLELAEAGISIGQDVSAPLRRADLLIRRGGYRSLAWRTAAIRSRAVHPSQRLAAFRRAFAAILESRLLTSSPIARTAYLQDKSDLISSYLSVLLSRPTPSNVREAVRVVSHSRSAALIDEILNSTAVSLDPEDLRELEELRAELHALETEGQRGDGSRRGHHSRAALASVQRRWIETTHRLVGAMATQPPEPESIILTRAGASLFAIHGDKAKGISVGGGELERELRWTRFEILAPMADRDAAPDEAMAGARRLGCGLIQPWMNLDAEAVAISPEGSLWQVPWTACLAALGSACEPVLSLHPALTKVADFQTLSRASAVLWVNPAEDLYHAGREEASFLEKFPGACVCRSADEARASLDRDVDILHVIGHAKHNAENPMFSSIQFSDGALYAAEIARSRLRAKFVTLSACETGSVSTAFRNEPDGLARAFLACGAQSVVGSLWPLDDEAASRFYEVVYICLLDGLGIIAALRQARCAVREWRSHPYYWGSPVLFGGYS